MCVAGKSSLLSALGNREFPIPDHIDIYHLQREMAPSDQTAIECVMSVDAERVRLEHEAEHLAAINSDGKGFFIAVNDTCSTVWECTEHCAGEGDNQVDSNLLLVISY